MIDPHKEKYHALYWAIAETAAEESYAYIAQVGAVVVTSSGMLSIGWNGMPSGMPNVPEYFDSEGKLQTRPEVIHAERNALDKMHRQGISTHGCIVFTTLSPCLNCAKSLLGLGIKAVYYDETHTETSGLALLESTGMLVKQRYTTF